MTVRLPRLPPSALAGLAAVSVAISACGGASPAVTTAPTDGAANAAPASAATAAAPSASPASPSVVPSASGASPASRPASPSPSPATTPVRTAAPAETASPTSSPRATPSPHELASAADALAGLDSYKVTFTVEGGISPGTGTMVVVREPVPAVHFQGPVIGDPVEIVIIGNDVWLTRDGKLLPKNITPAETARNMMAVFDPVLLFTVLRPLLASGALEPVAIEQKNDIETVRFALDPDAAPPEANLAPDAEVDIWIAADGNYLVGADISGVGDVSVAIDVTNVNDPELTVTPPS